MGEIKYMYFIDIMVNEVSTHYKPKPRVWTCYLLIHAWLFWWYFLSVRKYTWRGYKSEPKKQFSFLSNVVLLYQSAVSYQDIFFTIQMLRLPLSKEQENTDFWSKPYHVGIHWIALVKCSQISTNVPGF